MPLVTDTRRLCGSRWGAMVWHTPRNGKDGEARTTMSRPRTEAGSPEHTSSGGRMAPGSMGLTRVLVIDAAFSGL